MFFATRDGVRRIFAMLGQVGGQGFMGLDQAGVAVLKLEREDQLNMMAARPKALTPLSDYGHHGWTVAQLDGLDEATLALVVRLAWTHVAPKRLTRTP